MAPTPLRLAVVLNPNSGPDRSGAAEQDIVAAFETVGLKPDIVHLTSGSHVQEVVSQKVRSGFDAIIAAGGDGTVSLVGGIVAGTDTALGVLPTGTLNHFAKDVGLPSDLLAAARVIAAARTTTVDVAEVNGRTFLNNSSIGFYPTIVTERERRIQQGQSKMKALLPAALTAMWRFPNTAVRLRTEATGLVARTPFVFVGNNQYQFAGLQAGSRERMSDGLLHLCAIASTSRATLLKAVAMAIIGQIEAAPNVLMQNVKWARIETLRRHVRVALDGEVVRLESPLVYSIRPAALKVLVP